ncbi:ATP-dependent DNA helicase RRM3-like [Thrips palmi]|uniref:ATP-dependent DNA helicase n=1 Tax=Thrips palmi TaxID=161013 RepID=A0A6P8ZI17_THRPL|nr:ATP-dependent DNA helicase RRM3-like [Thrips palmi]
MANMSLLQVALTRGPPANRRDNRWSTNRREAVVRVFPRPKLTPNDEQNEEFYRVEVLLQVPWRTEEEAKGGFATWKEAFQANNLAPRRDRDIHALAAAAAAELRAEEAAERAQFEDPVFEGEEDDGLEEWMVAARMGAHGRVEQVELGRREVDLSYDWHASSDAYGDIAKLRTFVADSKAEHVEAPRERVLPDIVYSAEQQTVLNLLQSQIDSVLHPDPNARPVPKRVIIQGKAGSGKSTVIDKMMAMIVEAFGLEAVKLMAYTGVAALNIGGETINSCLKIPVQVGDYPEMNAEALRKFQDAMAPVRFLIVDEYSMVGSKLLGYMERRCRDGKPDCDDPFGGCFVYLVGDIRQLPPVGDPVLYPPLPAPWHNRAARQPVSPEVTRGRMAFASFQKSVILPVSQRQADDTLREFLDRLSVGNTTNADFARLSERFLLNVPVAEREAFRDALHIYWTRVEVMEHNIKRLVDLQTPVARIPARHHGPGAANGTTDAAGGLDRVLYLSKGARVMLRSNLWLKAGLVNGALGTVVDIIYRKKPSKASVQAVPRFEGESILLYLYVSECFFIS